MPLTHQVDTKVNASKQEAQEESEGHDTVEGPAAAPPTPQGPTSPRVSSTIHVGPNLESKGSASGHPDSLKEKWLGRVQLPTLRWRYGDEAQGQGLN